MKGILDAVDIVNQSVQPFIGGRNYLSTGDLNISTVKSFEQVTFENKPSRANLNVQEGDIIVARMKGTLKVKVITSSEEDIIVSTGFIVLRPKINTEKEYLFHLFKSSLFQRKKDKLCSGATQKAINNTNFKKIKIPLPLLEYQQKIAAILNPADKLVKLNYLLLEKYDQLPYSLFMEMFINNPERKNWKTRKIEDLAKKDKGSMRTGPFGSDLLHSEFVEKGISVLGIDNVVNNEFSWKERRYITKQKFESLSRYKVHPDEVLISIMGTVGRTAVVPDDIGLAINTKHLAAINLNKAIADPYFIAISIRSNPYILEQIRRRSKGAIMDGLNLTIIKKLELQLPPISEQQIFRKKYLNIQKQKEFAQQSLEKSSDLFQSLLQKAFKGELIKEETYEIA